MGQLRLLLLLYVRPLRAMSGIIDEGSLLLAAGLVLLASFLTSAAVASQVMRATPSEGAQALWITPGYDVGEESADPGVVRVEPTGFQQAFLGFFSATSSLSTIFALALLYAPFVLFLLNEHARWALAKFVEQRAHDPEGLYRLGLALSRLGQPEPAGQMFRRCVESVDTMPRYLRRKAGPWRKLADQQLGAWPPRC